MNHHPYVKQLRTGKVKKMGSESAKNPMERKWESAIYKQEQKEPMMLYKTGLEKDEVADKKNHGGPEKALFAYPAQHYPYWQEQLDTEEIDVGGMGENLVLEGVDEFSVFIGDTYRFGEAIIQVSQPRQPCWKPARRYKVLDFALRIQRSGRTGWYFRVLQEGVVHAETELELLERPYPEWSIAACNEVMHVRKGDLNAAYELASCTLLAENWKRNLQKRLRGQESNIRKRVYGPNVD